MTDSFRAILYHCHYPLYLALLVWAPLPYASNTPFHTLLLSLMILLLGGLWFLACPCQSQRATTVLKPFILPCLLLGVVTGWALIQSLNLGPSQQFTGYYSASQFGDSFISVSPGDTTRMALFSLGLFVFFLLTCLHHREPGRIRTTLLVIVISGTAQALYGSFMVLSGLEYGFFMEKEFYRGVATGTFINRNHLAGYLEMSLACGIGLLVSSLGQPQSTNWRARLRSGLDALLGPKMRLRVFLAFMVIALVLTRSRMGNTAFFASLVICSGLYMIAEKKIHWGAIILFASLMLVDFLIVGQWFGFDELAERLESTSVDSESRDEVSGDSLTMFQANPVTGYGLGTFYTAFLPFQENHTGYADHTHNDYLEFANDLGLIGFMPLALLVLASLWMGVTAMFQRRNQLAKGAGFAATMGITALLIHSAVDFNLQMPANAMLFVFILALAWLAKTQEWQDRPQR